MPKLLFFIQKIVIFIKVTEFRVTKSQWLNPYQLYALSQSGFGRQGFSHRVFSSLRCYWHSQPQVIKYSLSQAIVPFILKCFLWGVNEGISVSCEIGSSTMLYLWLWKEMKICTDISSKAKHFILYFKKGKCWYIMFRLRYFTIVCNANEYKIMGLVLVSCTMYITK
jgi:hypothetical protein